MTLSPKSMQMFWNTSYLAAGSEGYLETLYEAYLENPDNVSPAWRQYFEGLLAALPQETARFSSSAVCEHFAKLAEDSVKSTVPKTFSIYIDAQQERAIELINAYRRFGHLQAHIDPLGLYKGMQNPVLDLSYYGFTNEDLEKEFNSKPFLSLDKSPSSLKEIHAKLHQVYCSTIGFEYMQISREGEVEWIQERIEKGWANFKLSSAEKEHLLEKLVQADGLEKYLGFKFVGQKRFSLEGGDALIPLLNAIINRSAECGVKETVIGMAHRGRLNVLANIIGKNPKEIFAAFEGKGAERNHFSGDVKYHLGYASNINTSTGIMHVTLAFNPSHLEIVSPVVQGSVRARQRRRRNTDQKQVLPIQIHGDAAFAAQGVVMETFSMSQTRWFTVGGSIHIVVNNQVGFTISDMRDSRSTLYCTDAAKMIEAPILHVNGNDPEAVYFAALFAIDYRLAFKRDVVIDLVCYRRQGHNEADEPSATQPLMYQVIKSMPVPYQIYADKLIQAGFLKAETVKKKVAEYRQKMDAGENVVPISNDQKAYDFNVNWVPFIDQPWDQSDATSIPKKQLIEIARRLGELPNGFNLQPQVKKLYEARQKMTEGELPLNWGYAETLAYATLLDQGFPIRLCGQDSARGTFAHRHAVLHDYQTDEIYIPLSHLSEKQAQINIVDSLLSEEAVLAFEYGYASAEPNYLVIWEAQFGDFANGAQVVIDQFISSGEQKWERLCGLVMLLPHGYEGQGPEHSSARLERYLQLCAQDNIQVCIPTTPAQIYHLLRRQLIRPYRKPLIIISPKSLLRNPLATSTLDELASGKFQLVIPEIDPLNQEIRQLILCTGKIYYELLEKRRKDKQNDVALIRIEQLYPFPEKAIQAVLKTYQAVKDIIWCQEEPQNQGAWLTMQADLRNLLTTGQQLRYVGRKASASPAVGYHAIHELEQAEVIAQALMKRKPK